MNDQTQPAATCDRPSDPGDRWGRLPGVAVICSLGVLLVSYAHHLSRSAEPQAEPLYWAGLLLLILPISARLIGTKPGRAERIGTLVFLGLALYLVKISHSPFAFTYSDELVHLYNARAIVERGELFTGNPILAVTSFYPGLETITAAVALTSGLPLFTAGLIVIACARLVLLLGLYLLYEHVSGSSRAASLGVLLFMGSSNFVYWSVQYSYESLSYPLGILILYLLAQRFYTTDRRLQPGLTLSLLFVLIAVVMTHHLTSFAVFVFLLAVGLVQTIFRSTRARRIGSWGLVFLAFLAATTWLVHVGYQAVDYIFPVLRSAGKSVAGTVAGEEAPRALFTSHSGDVAPFWERWVGLSSVALLGLGLPVGLIQVWRQARTNALAIVLGVAALAYFPVLMLRFTPAGWEVSNRAANYLFVGLALVAGMAAARIWVPGRVHVLQAALFSILAAMILLGGIFAGWPPDLRLSLPYRIGTRAYTSEPQGAAAANWADSHLGADNRVATDETNARFMLAYGNQHVLTGTVGGLRLMMISPHFSSSDLQILQAGSIDYVVLDKRYSSWDTMRGVYYRRSAAGEIHPGGFLDELAANQFDGLRYVSKLLDTGYVAIYDVGALSGAKPVP